MIKYEDDFCENENSQIDDSAMLYYVNTMKKICNVAIKEYFKSLNIEQYKDMVVSKKTLYENTTEKYYKYDVYDELTDDTEQDLICKNGEELNVGDLVRVYFRTDETQGSTVATFGTFFKWINKLVDSITTTIKSIIDRINNPENIVFGIYTGDGTYDRTIDLGFEPVAVEIYCSDGTQQVYWNDTGYKQGYSAGGFALKNHPCYGHVIGNEKSASGSYDGSKSFTVTESGFIVSAVHWTSSKYPYTKDEEMSLNYTGQQYYFIAYRNYKLREFV